MILILLNSFGCACLILTRVRVFFSPAKLSSIFVFNPRTSFGALLIGLSPRAVSLRCYFVAAMYKIKFLHLGFIVHWVFRFYLLGMTFRTPPVYSPLHGTSYWLKWPRSPSQFSLWGVWTACCRHSATVLNPSHLRSAQMFHLSLSLRTCPFSLIFCSEAFTVNVSKFVLITGWAKGSVEYSGGCQCSNLFITSSEVCPAVLSVVARTAVHPKRPAFEPLWNSIDRAFRKRGPSRQSCDQA